MCFPLGEGIADLFPPVGIMPRSLLRLLNENLCRIPRLLAAASFILIEAGMAVPYDGGKKTHNWCE